MVFLLCLKRIPQNQCISSRGIFQHVFKGSNTRTAESTAGLGKKYAGFTLKLISTRNRDHIKIESNPLALQPGSAAILSATSF